MSTRYEIRFKNGEREKFEACAAAEHMDLAAWIRVALHREVERVVGEELAARAVLTEDRRIQDIRDMSMADISEKPHD